ncbi:aminotransferase class V-fold PLP-dependent enzyme [Microbispora triticiradicis]|uniref:aminotransferase class V-fold PLP-dependent enzyme n=1 Tax=Microbispora triticiradicis TaxID=2200763 RepID=UPI001AD75CFF|nr:aminotransferase class V-fold PLP-dependent enzyme [Microbispora triticiradicis]MBO4272164.1 aminotransferase class V-fold PLP-dependent enzyme [Microbispora triticiradicis]
MKDIERLASLRAEFPVLSTCVYLNSNSTGAVPRGVEDVLGRYWRTLAAWRDEEWSGWLDEMSGYTETLARFIGAPPGAVVTDVNLSTLLARVATCLDFEAPRDRVVTTDLEFPTVPFLWRGFARYGAVLEVVGSGGPDFDQDALEAAIDERTVCVCVSHGSYSTGAVLDLRRIVDRAHSVGAYVVVDAYQTVGVLPVDVTALGVDFLLGGAHKWMCGAGTAFLYVRPDIVPNLRPAATGWFAGEDPTSFTPPAGWAAGARRLAGGTPVPVGPMMSRVGLDLLSGLGAQAIRRHSLICTDRVIERADAAGIEVVTPRDRSRRGGVVCLRFPGDRQVREALVRRDMVCSWRGSLRVAPHFYTTLEEVDAFMDALEIERARIAR